MPLTPVTDLRVAAGNVPSIAPIGGPFANAERHAARVVSAYDFRRPTKLSREHVRTLQMAYETFARRLTTVLTSGLRQVCHVAVGDVAQQSYDEYVSSLPASTLMVPLEVDPIGRGALELSLPLALAAFDHMLGGPGGLQPARTLTDIETSIFGNLIEQILGVLRYAFESITPITVEPGPIEYNPQFLQVAGATDAVVVGQFDLTIGRESSLLTLCLPLARLLPKLTVRPREHSSPSVIGADPRLRERLVELPVEMTVRFNPCTLSSSAVLGLQVGDVLPLEHHVGSALDVVVGGSPVAQAVAGRSGQQLAALIVDVATPHVKEQR